MDVLPSGLSSWLLPLLTGIWTLFPVGAPVGAAPPTEVPAREVPQGGPRLAPAGPQSIHPPGRPTTTAPQSSPPREIRMRDGTLTIDGQPLAPRVIVHRGEPLDQLAEIGFNVVLLNQLPTAAQQAAAAKLGLWIVCPPPDEESLARAGFGAGYPTVIAWNLGRDRSAVHFSQIQRWTKSVRRTDPLRGRPVLVDAASHARAFSRVTDVLIYGRGVLGSSLEFADYGSWIQQAPRLARLGTPHWLRIATDHDPLLAAQISNMAEGPTPDFTWTDTMLEQFVDLAVASGSRGLVFESRESLSANNAAARRRALELRLINRRLRLLQPWLRSGHVVSRIRSSDTELSAVLLQTERHRILIPISWGKNAQYVPFASSSRQTVFVVPGIPESNDAYLISTSDMSRLRAKRVTGGLQVVVDRSLAGNYVLITEDPQVVTTLHTRIAQMAAETARLENALANESLQFVQETTKELAARRVPIAYGNAQLSQVRGLIDASTAAVTTAQFGRARQLAREARGQLSQMMREQWQRTVNDDSPVTFPLAASFATLAEHKSFADAMRFAAPADGMAFTGDFEDLAVMQRNGWTNLKYPTPGIESAVELSPLGPQSGNYCLKLEVREAANERAPAILPTTPVWVTSPAIQVAKGQVVEISAYVRVPEQIEGSVDGLQIIDSLGGDGLSFRIGTAPTWQRIVAYRAAPQDTQLVLTFALTGLGTACIDGVAVRTVPRTPRDVADRQQSTQLFPAPNLRLRR